MHRPYRKRLKSQLYKAAHVVPRKDHHKDPHKEVALVAVWVVGWALALDSALVATQEVVAVLKVKVVSNSLSKHMNNIAM